MEYIDIKNGYSKQDVKKVAEIINKNGCAIVPTDTVYGIVASALDTYAVKKVYEVKKRKFTKPINILVSNIGMIKEVTKKISAEEEKIIEKFFPGALTIIFEKNDKIPDIVTSGLNSIGVRMPKHKFLLEVIEELR